MEALDKLVRENVIRLKSYSSARDEYSGRKGIFLDANENPYGSLNRYPDPLQRELKGTISAIKGIDEANIFLGNGSDEVIDLSYRIFCNPGKDKALIFSPTYGMYEVAAAINDVQIIRIPLLENFQIDLEQLTPLLNDKHIKLLFICSPNNPTGNCINEEDILFILKNFRGIVILDEAYMDFSERSSFSKLTGTYENIIVLQTFSKALGLAAIRIGMAFSNPSILYYFNKLKPPYNISTINQEAARKKIVMVAENNERVRSIKSEREILRGRLRSLKITTVVYPSEANFLLVKFRDAEAVFNTLIANEIIVRNRTSVLPGCLRITVGTPEENERLINTLEKI